MLRDFVKIPKGGCIIQNGSNSGVGRMVIQLCKLSGIKTINIVRERPELETLKDELHSLGADIVVTNAELRNPEMRNTIKALHPCLGLNCVGGKVVTEMARLLAPGAALVTYGGMSREPVSLPTSLLIFNKVSFHGFWMTQWIDDFHSVEPSLRQAMCKELIDMMAADQLHSPPHATLAWIEASSDSTLLEKCLKLFPSSTPGTFSPPKSIFLL
ncbi:mitochondrial 2-enoyl thioester reductase [Entomophthora muscae]|uniref:Mitochondrial 2-enoyl thioester reductase n=1 Tax=Entomophthora muscae TaxID=34485 RepID=A0ACC2RNI8_9FUNG|nr:mitochondrial 2-enoyl thioester reductase [Entomophthora muscae]